ncbi:DNA/RNA nuclease SfsA [Neptunicella sp. SCSIO 80796]|uniref:DNA/RNA nuclease SfsA n=1 Tax=Neptunicella plasticusilytica TaxID=3117012 RepID=UPI003A4D9B13
MKFVSPLIKGKLIKRYKRFFADIELDDGQIAIAHCANTGSMKNCADPGWIAYLSKHNNPKRKLAYSWELVENHQQQIIGINTHNANKLVAEALQNKIISELADYEQIAAEVKYGDENSRIDFLLSAPGLADCYVEVKSVTLLENGCGYFPDAVTKRGQKHLRELVVMVEQGYRAVLFFAVQHSGIQQVKVADHIDADYATQLQLAINAGVQILAYRCELQQQNYFLDQSVPFICDKTVDF